MEPKTSVPGTLKLPASDRFGILKSYLIIRKFYCKDQS